MKRLSQSSRDISGEKFNRLTAVSPASPKKNGEVAWNCVCDCENKTETIVSYFALVRNRTKSCGCLVKEFKQRKFYYEISRGRWVAIESAARLRNKEFKITIEFIWRLYLKQNRKCALTGIEIVMDTPTNRVINSASLDRIDSSKGYTEDNVQWVLDEINFMKCALSQDKFISLCQKVANYHS